MPTENRLIVNLEARARRAKDPGERAEALCLILIHKARQGHIDAARTDLAVLRGDPSLSQVPKAIGWMQLAEGVIARVQCEYGHALQAMQSAYNSASSAELLDLRCACAAALGELAFAMSQVETMRSRLSEVFREASADDHHSMARACQAMAVAMHYAGGRKRAQVWYDRLHRHAIADGDQATLSAMFHNITAMDLADLRMLNAFREDFQHDVDRLRYEESTHRFYDIATGVTSQEAAMLLMKGQIRILTKENDQAEAILEKIDRQQLRYSDVPIFLSDLATAKKNLGAVHEAKVLAEESLRLIGNLNDPDDYAYVYARLADIADAVEEKKWSEDLRSRAKTFRKTLEETKTYWLQQLEAVEEEYQRRS